jgi:hypothetical protein
MLDSSVDVSLAVMAIVDDRPTIELMQRTLDASGDALSVATNLAEGLARTAFEVPDIVPTSRSTPRGSRPAPPARDRLSVQVFAMARADRPEFARRPSRSVGRPAMLPPPATSS